MPLEEFRPSWIRHGIDLIAVSYTHLQAMAGALQDADVPASTEAYNRGSYRLTSSVTTAPTVTGIVISVDWQLTGADGSKLGGAASRTETDDAALSKSGDLVAKALAAPAVPAILKLRCV